MIENAAALAACTNCGANAAEIYCAHCGERQPGHHDLGLSHLALILGGSLVAAIAMVH